MVKGTENTHNKRAQGICTELQSTCKDWLLLDTDLFYTVTASPDKYRGQTFIVLGQFLRAKKGSKSAAIMARMSELAESFEWTFVFVASGLPQLETWIGKEMH